MLSCLMLAWMTIQPAHAQARLSLIRDAEIEWTIRSYGEPLLRAAGVNPNAVRWYIVNSSSLNAFVAGGQAIYINTGTIMQSERPEELIGVIAHEIGHIAGGHIARGSEAIEQARLTSLITTILSIGAGVAAGRPDIGVGGLLAGNSVATRGFLSFTRAMENAADQAALRYLDRVEISAEGLLAFFERIGDQDLLPATAQVEYVRTHPLTPDRMDAVRAHVATSEFSGRPAGPWVQNTFARMQAKLRAFLQPRVALRLYEADSTDIADLYGRAIALYRTRAINEALEVMNQLLTIEADNPFFHELKGQILFEQGRLVEARPHYDAAVALLPNEPLLLVPLAQTKLASGTQADRRSAIEDLRTATRNSATATPIAWRLLATALGREGDLGQMSLALAEESLARGDLTNAKAQATRAQQQLQEGSPAWIRAQDILAL